MFSIYSRKLHDNVLILEFASEVACFSTVWCSEYGSTVQHDVKRSNGKFISYNNVLSKADEFVF